MLIHKRTKDISLLFTDVVMTGSQNFIAFARGAH